MMPSRSSMALFLPDRPSLYTFLARRDDDAVHEDAGRVDALGIELADLDELLDLRDGHLPRRRRHRVEVARRLPVHEVAEAVGLPRGDHREVPDDAPLEK